MQGGRPLVLAHLPHREGAAAAAGEDVLQSQPADVHRERSTREVRGRQAVVGE